MAVECYKGGAYTMLANADLSTHQYKFIVNSSGLAAVAGAGVAAEGVLQNKPTSGKAGTIWGCGSGSESKVVAATSLAVGVIVTSDGSGRAIAATSGDFQLGTVTYAAANTGEICTVRLINHGRKA